MAHPAMYKAIYSVLRLLDDYFSWRTAKIKLGLASHLMDCSIINLDECFAPKTCSTLDDRSQMVYKKYDPFRSANVSLVEAIPSISPWPYLGLNMQNPWLLRWLLLVCTILSNLFIAHCLKPDPTDKTISRRSICTPRDAARPSVTGTATIQLTTPLPPPGHLGHNARATLQGDRFISG
jgi:hypothetical protein